MNDQHHALSLLRFTGRFTLESLKLTWRIVAIFAVLILPFLWNIFAAIWNFLADGESEDDGVRNYYDTLTALEETNMNRHGAPYDFD